MLAHSHRAQSSQDESLRLQSRISPATSVPAPAPMLTQQLFKERVKATDFVFPLPAVISQQVPSKRMDLSPLNHQL